jgi:hypothetical protein
MLVYIWTQERGMRNLNNELHNLCCPPCISEIKSMHMILSGQVARMSEKKTRTKFKSDYWSQWPWQFEHWDSGFESRLRNGGLSAFFCLVPPYVSKGLARLAQVPAKKSYQMLKKNSKAGNNFFRKAKAHSWLYLLCSSSRKKPKPDNCAIERKTSEVSSYPGSKHRLCNFLPSQSGVTSQNDPGANRRELCGKSCLDKHLHLPAKGRHPSQMLTSSYL